MGPFRCAALAVTLLLGAAACGSDGAAPQQTKKAAEPATAPAMVARPAGTVHLVGDHPEGIVYDALDNLVVVALRDPNRLELLDPATLAFRKSIPLPGSVRHLELGTDGRTVLVPVETAGVIDQVTLPGGAVVSTKVLRQPHNAAQVANGDVVVDDEFGRQSRSSAAAW